MSLLEIGSDAMDRLRRTVVGLSILAVIAAAFWLWWTVDLRWRPHALTREPGQIAHGLDRAGWVSPRTGGPRLYIIAYRDCPGCTALLTAELAKLQRAGVDTRVIMVARGDRGGLSQSTPAERATVAELWTNRDFGLLRQWMAAPTPAAWTAPGLRPVEGDVARMAVIEAGRQTVEDITRLLKRNGMGFAYPLAIWWTKAGVMHGRVLDQPGALRPMEEELGA